MIDVWRRIEYGDTGSGDFAEITIESMQNFAILLGNESVYGERRFVVYESDVNALIDALVELKTML